MALTDSIPEPLTRKVGPFPVWVWVAGVGGGLLLYVYMSRTGGMGSGGGESDETAEAAEYDFGESAVASGPASPYASPYDNTAGQYSEPSEYDFESLYDNLNDTADAASAGSASGEPIGGTTIVKNIRNIRKVIVRRPNGRKRATKKRNVTPRQRQAPKRKVARPKQAPKSQQRRRKSFALDEPHIDYAVAPNGAPPTVTTYNVPAIGIAAPDRTPRRKMAPLNTTRAADEPFVAAKVPPSPISRAWGRPFHGANRSTQVG